MRFLYCEQLCSTHPIVRTHCLTYEYLILMIITEQSRVGASSVVRLWTLWTVATLNQSPPVHS